MSNAQAIPLPWILQILQPQHHPESLHLQKIKHKIMVINGLKTI